MARKSGRSKREGSKPKARERSESSASVENAAVRLVKDARELVAAEVTRRATKASGDIHRLAKALELASAQLEGNVASPYVDELAARLERASRRIEELDGREVVQEIERFARREPLWFAGGALAVGAIGARFLKTAAPPA